MSTQLQGTVASPALSPLAPPATSPVFAPASDRAFKHVPALDGVRGIAILLVLLHHLTPFKELRYGLLDVGPSIAYAGWIGVDLFFALSAYLITSILIRDRGSERYYTNFYARRALRILPLYFAVLGIELIVLPLLFPAQFGMSMQERSHAWSLWLFVANFNGVSDTSFRVLGHVWSLSMEEQFYVAWAVLIALTPPKRLVTVTSLVGIGLLVGQTAMFASGSSPGFGQTIIRADAVCRFDAFVAGSLLAALTATKGLGAREVRWSWLLVVLTGIPLAQLVRTHVLNDALQTSSSASILLLKSSVFPLLAVFFTAGIAIASVDDGRLKTLLTIPGLRALGRYSYGIYLLHGILLPFFRWLMPADAMTRIAGGPNAASFLYFAIASAISVACAMVSYRLLERPFLLMKQRFSLAAA